MDRHYLGKKRVIPLTKLGAQSRQSSGESPWTDSSSSSSSSSSSLNLRISNVNVGLLIRRVNSVLIKSGLTGLCKTHHFLTTYTTGSITKAMQTNIFFIYIPDLPPLVYQDVYIIMLNHNMYNIYIYIYMWCIRTWLVYEGNTKIVPSGYLT